jgi:hypothetical protein
VSTDGKEYTPSGKKAKNKKVEAGEDKISGKIIIIKCSRKMKKMIIIMPSRHLLSLAHVGDQAWCATATKYSIVDLRLGISPTMSNIEIKTNTGRN